MKVAILGASANPEKYAYKAFKKLVAHGHQVYPLNPHLQFLNGYRVYNSLTMIKEKIDTLTLYVNAEKSSKMIAEIIALHPQRIIFNPGTENDLLRHKAEEAGIKTISACTLMLLSTNQF